MALALREDISDEEIIQEYQAREDGRDTLAGYARYVGEVTPAKHHQIICDALDDALLHVCTENRGEDIKFILIAAPPGSAKSTYSSHLFPAYAMAKMGARGGDKYRRIIVASYGQDLANEIGDKVRKNLASENHAILFPEGTLNKKKSAIANFESMSGTGFYATGVGGAITGKRADILIIDDPFKGRAQADSKSEREKVWKWYKSEAKSRVKPGGVVIVIATRWHEDDLTGKLISLFDESGEKYKYIKFEALCEDSESDPLGRDVGEALWPEWESAAVLRSKRDVDYRDDPREWSSLYQQSPSPQDGNQVLRTWFKEFDRAKMDNSETKASLIFYQSWDTAGNTKNKSDPSVGITFAVDVSGRVFLWHVERRKLEFPDLLRLVQEQAASYMPSAILIENKGSGQSLLQTLKSTALRTIEINPQKEGDKAFRFERAIPYIEGSKLYVDKSLPFTAAYIEELVTFPAAKNDDQVDATSQFLNWLAGRRGRGRGQTKMRGN